MYDDLELKIQHEIPLDVDLSIEGQLELTISEGSGSPLPYYDGSYQIVPRKIEQVLDTKNKSMRDDVVVDPINYAEVTNPQGGLTATIGFE